MNLRSVFGYATGGLLLTAAVLAGLSGNAKAAMMTGTMAATQFAMAVKNSRSAPAALTDAELRTFVNNFLDQEVARVKSGTPPTPAPPS